MSWRFGWIAGRIVECIDGSCVGFVWAKMVDAAACANARVPAERAPGLDPGLDPGVAREEPGPKGNRLLVGSFCQCIGWFPLASFFNASVGSRWLRSSMHRLGPVGFVPPMDRLGPVGFVPPRHRGDARWLRSAKTPGDARWLRSAKTPGDARWLRSAKTPGGVRRVAHLDHAKQTRH